MVFLDSNIFIIDRFFPRDQHYDVNKHFLSFIKELPLRIVLPYYTLLEICGAASFNLSEEELKHWLYSFDKLYPVEILDPFDAVSGGQTNLGASLRELGDYITRRMTVGDAMLLREAELYRAETIITWNKKHFLERTKIRIATPPEFQEQRL